MEFPFSRTFGAGTHNLSPTDLNVLADTTDGAVNFVLPSIASVVEVISRQGYSSGNVGVFPMNITDIGDASVNNITVTTNGDDKLNGDTTSLVINQKSGTASLKPASNTVWNVVQSGSGGAVDGYIFAGNFTANDILTNGVYIPNAANIEPIYNNSKVTKLDIISLQANEVVTDIIISCPQAFTYSEQGELDGAIPAIYVRQYVIGGFSDSFNILPIGTNPNAPSLQRYVNTFGKSSLYTYNTQAPYNYSLFFQDTNSGEAIMSNIMTNASGSISVWYKKTTIS